MATPRSNDDEIFQLLHHHHYPDLQQSRNCYHQHSTYGPTQLLWNAINNFEWTVFSLSLSFCSIIEERVAFRLHKAEISVRHLF